ncbi:MAG TPA: DUF3592 domain-containing protein [Allosphingosinicella sp.]
MEPVALGLIVLGLVWALGFGYAHFRAAGKAKASESWPTASGTVRSAEVQIEESTDREGGTSTWYNPIVVYSYSAGGRELEGRRLRFGNPRSSSRKKADAAIAPYAVGSSVPVRYNPEKPEECVLETRKPSPIYLILAIFGLPFIAIGLFFNQLVA